MHACLLIQSTELLDHVLHPLCKVPDGSHAMTSCLCRQMVSAALSLQGRHVKARQGGTYM